MSISSFRVRQIAVLAVIAVASACRAARSKPHSTDDAVAPLPRYVAIPDARLREDWSALSRCDAAEVAQLEPAWSIDSSLARRVDSTVRPLIADAIRKRGIAASDANDYFLQFMGVLMRGQRLVLVNGIRGIRNTESSLELQAFADFAREFAYEHPLVVCDGGVIRLTALVDTIGGSIRPVMFNRKP